MERIKIRPRFKRKVSCKEVDVIKRFEEALAKKDSPIVGTVAEHYVYLKIPYEDQHYWSPQLTVNIEEHDGGTSVQGVFGPRGSVWLMYIFFYTVLAVATLFIMITGFSQLNLGLSARILWALPVLLLLFGLAYGTAKAGEKLGHDEMHKLYNFFEKIVSDNGCILTKEI